MFSLLDQCSSPHPYLTVPACYRPGIRSSLFAPVPVHPPQDETSYFQLPRIGIPFSVCLVFLYAFSSSLSVLYSPGIHNVALLSIVPCSKHCRRPFGNRCGTHIMLSCIPRTSLLPASACRSDLFCSCLLETPIEHPIVFLLSYFFILCRIIEVKILLLW